MPTRIFESAVADAIAAAQRNARDGLTRSVPVDGAQRSIRVPFPSPADWRQVPIYFLMLDRFNNAVAAPEGATAMLEAVVSNAVVSVIRRREPKSASAMNG